MYRSVFGVLFDESLCCDSFFEWFGAHRDLHVLHPLSLLDALPIYAFCRWIATDEARPYLAAFAADRAPPSGSEFFAADLTAEDLLDSDHLAELAQKIEAAHG